MLEYWEGLGRRAVACPGWRLVPGMVDLGGYRALAIDLDDARVQLCEPDGPSFWASLKFLPDLRDPATVGCLLALVREKYGPAVPAPRGRDFSSSWNVIGPSSNMIGPDIIVLGAGKTEAEALVAALEAQTNG